MQFPLPFRRALALAVFFLLPAAAAAQSVADMSHAPVGLAPAAAGKTDAVELESRGVAGEYNGVILRGFAADGQTRGWIRFPASADPEAWHPLYVVFSATSGTFLAAYRGAVVRQAEPFVLRFDVAPGVDFRVEEAGLFDTRLDAHEASPGDGPMEDGPAADVDAAGLVVPPRVVRRSQWRAKPFIGSPEPLSSSGRHQYLTFHHAAGFGASTLEEGMEQVRRIQDFHQNGRGWSDIGYHFLADQSGNIYQGRPFLDERKAVTDLPALALGAHAGGANTANIGLCILGCFHPAEGPNCRDVITPAALDSVVTMFAFLAEGYQVPAANLRGHRDFGSTSCPGDNNYVLLPEMRVDIAALLVTGNQAVGTATLAAEAGDAGVVRLSWMFVEDYGIARYRVERVYGGASAVVYEATGAAPEAFVDTAVPGPGPLSYRLYAVSQTGREQLLAVADVEVDAPAHAALAGSFPNPFAGTTTIRYYLEHDGIVRLRVYDLAGREVATLADTFQEGGRWYLVPFSADGLASGTYFYRLQVEGFSGITFEDTRAVVVAR